MGIYVVLTLMTKTIRLQDKTLPTDFNCLKEQTAQIDIEQLSSKEWSSHNCINTFFPWGNSNNKLWGSNILNTVLEFLVYLHLALLLPSGNRRL